MNLDNTRYCHNCDEILPVRQRIGCRIGWDRKMFAVPAIPWCSTGGRIPLDDPITPLSEPSSTARAAICKAAKFLTLSQGGEIANPGCPIGVASTVIDGIKLCHNCVDGPVHRRSYVLCEHVAFLLSAVPECDWSESPPSPPPLWPGWPSSPRPWWAPTPASPRLPPPPLPPSPPLDWTRAPEHWMYFMCQAAASGCAVGTPSVSIAGTVYCHNCQLEGNGRGLYCNDNDAHVGGACKTTSHLNQRTMKGKAKCQHEDPDKNSNAFYFELATLPNCNQTWWHGVLAPWRRGVVKS